MTRAIARQDEALEDLIRSTRQVIRKHSTYLAHTNDHDDYNFHRRPTYATHKPRLQPPIPPQCSHYCCGESITKPIPPKARHYHHVQPHPPPPPPPAAAAATAAAALPQQQPSHPQPFPTKSRTKTWLNKIIPSKLQYETDDEIDLHDLKSNIYKQKPKPQEKQQQQQQQQHQQLPSIKTTGRPMIIPSVASSPEKVVVIDVPADTTVILRSIDADDPASKQMATMYHITDMNAIQHLFGHVQMTESKSTGDIKAHANPGVKKKKDKKMTKSHTMQLSSIQTSHFPPNSGANTPLSTSSAATVVNSQEQPHQQLLPQKKPKGMAQYMSMPAQLSLKAQEFHYMDSDASTVDHRGEHSPSSMSSTASSLYYQQQQERVAAVPHTARGWMR